MTTPLGYAHPFAQLPVFGALPNVDVPIQAVIKAGFMRINDGVRALPQTKDCAIYASCVITLLESVYPRNPMKVHLYILNRGLSIVEKMTFACQKIELLIRMARLLAPEERYTIRDKIEATYKSTLLSQFCPSLALIQLAFLCAQTKEMDRTITWLEKGKASKDKWEHAAEILSRQGAPEEARLLISQAPDELTLLTMKRS